MSHLTPDGSPSKNTDIRTPLVAKSIGTLSEKFTISGDFDVRILRRTSITSQCHQKSFFHQHNSSNFSSNFMAFSDLDYEIHQIIPHII